MPLTTIASFPGTILILIVPTVCLVPSSSIFFLTSYLMIYPSKRPWGRVPSRFVELAIYDYR